MFCLKASVFLPDRDSPLQFEETLGSFPRRYNSMLISLPFLMKPFPSLSKAVSRRIRFRSLCWAKRFKSVTPSFSIAVFTKGVGLGLALGQTSLISPRKMEMVISPIPFPRAFSLLSSSDSSWQTCYRKHFEASSEGILTSSGRRLAN